MPYQGDSVHPPSTRRFTTDFAYVTKLPGVIILVQLGCCMMGFVLALNVTIGWSMRGAHAFFTIVVFLSMLSCLCWIVLRVLQLQELFNKSVNWNIAGLVHNGINSLSLLIASCVMMEFVGYGRTLKAAAVFGFLGFSAFLVGLVWEAITWHSDKDSMIGFSTATVIRGRERDKTPESEASAGVANEREEEGVSFVGIKPRPVSSFLDQENGGNGRETSTPMLIVPRDDSDGANSSRSSAVSSIQGEWQMASTYVT